MMVIAVANRCNIPIIFIILYFYIFIFILTNL